ncbi:hypothetical protein P692DRAFT_20822217 [Suillus brevipes Sb2]|nr:hypothetical protein P692DRAFT_20822217 [Suillus brevipes Sb2]
MMPLLKTLNINQTVVTCQLAARTYQYYQSEVDYMIWQKDKPHGTAWPKLNIAVRRLNLMAHLQDVDRFHQQLSACEYHDLHCYQRQYICCLKEEMDQLVKNELMPMPDSDVPLYEFWEEKITNWTLSILDTLIPASNLDIEALYAIRYIKKKGNDIHCALVLQNLRSGPEWQINGAFAGAVKKTRRE